MGAIAIFPDSVNDKSNSQGVSRDCFTLSEGSTTENFAYHLHSDIGDGLLCDIGRYSERRIKSDHELPHRDVVEVVSANWLSRTPAATPLYPWMQDPDMDEAETTAVTLSIEIGGLSDKVTLADLFPSPWVESHREVTSISGFFEKGELAVADQDSFESISTHKSDRYVGANTKFDGWQTILSAGIERYVLEQEATGEATADVADEVEAAKRDGSMDAKTEDSLEAGV